MRAGARQTAPRGDTAARLGGFREEGDKGEEKRRKPKQREFNSDLCNFI